MREILETDVAAIVNVISAVLGVERYNRIERLGGLTNHTYHIETEKGDYVVRLPGEGTDKMISRRDEEISTRLASSLGIDSNLIYFGKDGTKISAYVENAETMSPSSMGDESNIRKAADIFKALHGCGIDTGVPFGVFEMAALYEDIIKEHSVAMYDDYPEIKAQVMQIKASVDEEFGINLVPCHNDSLCENWIIGGGQGDASRMYLVDWEYAGMNDGMWDLADLSIEAGYDRKQDELLLEHYTGDKVDNGIYRHFIANKIYVDFLWTLWAKTRVPFDGKPMEDWADTRYSRLRDNLRIFATLGGKEK